MAPAMMASMTATVTIAAIILGSSFQTGTAAILNLRSNSTLSSSLGAIREAYTTNAICGKKNCINPIFPGMEDLSALSESKWICSSLQKVAPSMGFCRNAVTYDPALPLPQGGSSQVKALVQRQDNAASTMFYYHLTGLGLEAWDYQKPEFADDCIKSIWRMVCFTYFPRAEIGCQDGSWSNYIRPCQSSCMNYLRQCNVECCDESVQCVFEHTKAINAKTMITTKGYSPHDGPSSLCTGASQQSATIFWALLVIMIAMSLQGCDYDVPVHNVGNWRGQPDYLIKNEFVPPGASPRDASLNSCSLTRLSQTLQCSGRGVCTLWDPKDYSNNLAFCECDRDWTDPECRTQRKSQTIAYLLAMFFGFVGADQFYLGFIRMGILKLFTFGGFGVLWVTDMITVGSAPVYSSTYRIAADLPHYGFVLTATMFAVFMGFLIAYVLTVNFRSAKRREAMLLQSDEESRQASQGKLFADAYKTGDTQSSAPTKPVIINQGNPGDGFPDMDNQGQMGMGQMTGYGAMGQGPPTMMGQSMNQMGPPNMGSMMGGSMPPQQPYGGSSMQPRGQYNGGGSNGQSFNMPPGGSMNMGPTPPGSTMMPQSMNMGGQMPMSTASMGMNPFGNSQSMMARP